MLLPPLATASPARLHHISGIGTVGIGAASPLVTTPALDLGAGLHLACTTSRALGAPRRHNI
ncbi:hypothetical protein E2562_031282 [Oryza meyeriana var. granulata]|uniref:Uncharacterized protein n=1 Tax=Oryza meyeriana var. granulata TaxID=110450 RepID=A0A6G1C900_9ORYZ|nr:hypothetical protein E2562_031282 [Oryza meyeriana var. granulata]